MFKEIKSQKALLVSIRQNESKYTAAIQKKKKEAKRIDGQIEKLIRSAIVASNKKSGKKVVSSSKFLLTPEATVVANYFIANKGKIDMAC